LVLEKAERAALQDHPVLVTGETGTGKDLIAKAVHNGRGPFIVIDCTRLSKEMADRELFGNVRGAYTGADQSAPGLLSEANGGSAFFDEIGELPLDAQCKLLRALQEKQIRPIGSSKHHPAQFRVIAATNRDLKSEVAAGRFRQDLYFRINVVRIEIPPLRERHEDIQLLLTHYAREYGIAISAKATQRLLCYSWPGNVRELENAIARLAVNSRSCKIEVEDLSATISGRAPGLVAAPLTMATRNLSNTKPSPSENDRDEPGASYRSPAGQATVSSLDDWKRLAIASALVANGGNRKRTASSLGVSRATLYRHLKALDKNERFFSTLRDVAGSEAKRDPDQT
jgi:DNA-binding NtrC family response regulator